MTMPIVYAIFFSILISPLLAQLYVDPLSSPDVLTGIEYTGECQSISVEPSTEYVSYVQNISFTNSTIENQILFTANYDGPACSSISALLSLSGNYSIIGPSNVSAGVYDIDIWYSTKTIIVYNELVLTALSTLVNSQTNGPCFANQTITNFNLDTLLDLSQTDCDPLGLYSCNPVTTTIQLELGQLGKIDNNNVTLNSTALRLGGYSNLGPGCSNVYRPTVFNTFLGPLFAAGPTLASPTATPTISGSVVASPSESAVSSPSTSITSSPSLSPGVVVIEVSSSGAAMESWIMILW